MTLPSEAQVRSDLADALEAAGEKPASSIIDGLAAHARLLLEWNRRFSLTRITSWSGILDRHVKESLMPLRWIGTEGLFLDIGSGNGYPALPILLCRPELTGVLVERSDRKSLFLQEALRRAGIARASVIAEDLRPRGEIVASLAKRRADYVISRATLPPNDYLAIAARILSRSGRAFLFAGACEAREAMSRASQFEMIADEEIADRRDSRLFVLELAPASAPHADS